MPAVMNTMSESWTTAESSVRLSSAASRPRVQSPPAPRPRVILLPMWTLTSAWQRSSACLSVFTAMNSTFSAFEIIRLTALPPPPPQPTTLMRARPSCNKLSFTTSSWFSCPLAFAMASSSWFRVSSLEKISQPPHCFLIGQADGHRLSCARVAAGWGTRSPLDEADRHRERGALRAVGEAGSAEGLAESHRCLEHRLRRLRGAHHARAAPSHHDAGGQEAGEAPPANPPARHLED